MVFYILDYSILPIFFPTTFIFRAHSGLKIPSIRAWASIGMNTVYISSDFLIYKITITQKHTIAKTWKPNTREYE